LICSARPEVERPRVFVDSEASARIPASSPRSSILNAPLSGTRRISSISERMISNASWRVLASFRRWILREAQRPASLP
jgi:hypothetical protein